MLTRRGAGTGPAAGDAAPPPGTPERPAAVPSRGAWADAGIVLGSLLCAAIGLTVMVSMLARVTVVLQFDNHHPMTFSTALAVTVTGAALAASAAGRRWPALVAGVTDAALGILIRRACPRPR